MSPGADKIQINGELLQRFDTAGALALIQLIDSLQGEQKQVELVQFCKEQKALLQLVEEKKNELTYKPPLPQKHGLIYILGKETVVKLQQAMGFCSLMTSIVVCFINACGNLRKFQFPSILANINAAGIKALPILALLSFLIGVVLAYQMGLQLKTYGAVSFIAYISGMAIFREFASLITAIIVAGRTSSAFTAQIGNMKINEEIDALATMGLSPIEFLVLPKVLALLIVFPLLIFWSDVFSILGAMIMSKFMLYVGPYDFLFRLQDEVGISQLLLGLYKAPTFALLIALVGCFQGFKVQGSADNLGAQTTKSVVQALFLIIVADAIYSIIYSWLNL